MTEIAIENSIMGKTRECGSDVEPEWVSHSSTLVTVEFMGLMRHGLSFRKVAS